MSDSEHEDDKYTIIYENDDNEYHAVVKDGKAKAIFHNKDTYG